VGLDEVNTAVSQMDQITQQNAAMVEEATAASHSLTNEAQSLNKLLGRFTLAQNDSSAPVQNAPGRRSTPEKTKPVRRAVPVLKTVSSLAHKPHAAEWENF
jgi:methyl-accepting chemotaxis protein